MITKVIARFGGLAFAQGICGYFGRCAARAALADALRYQPLRLKSAVSDAANIAQRTANFAERMPVRRDFTCRRRDFDRRRSCEGCGLCTRLPARYIQLGWGNPFFASPITWRIEAGRKKKAEKRQGAFAPCFCVRTSPEPLGL